VTHAIRKHLGDFAAIVGLILLAIVVGGYILYNQEARGPLPFVEEKPFEVKAEFVDAQAVTPGQGQSVRIAGVKVGTITKVDLDEGKAVVTLALEPKYGKRLRTNASALLRPRTGLKDMFVELEPGTKDAPRLEEKGVIPSQNTAPDIDPDEFFSALDSDTRSYLKLLISGAGKGLAGRGGDLREVFRRFEPLHRDIARVTTAIAERRANLRRLVTNYADLTTELATKDKEIVRLVEASQAVLHAFASEDENISATVAKLPGALRQTQTTLGKVDTLADNLGPSLDRLRPAFRQLDEANAAVRPFARASEPVLRQRIRPFVRAARPYVRDLQPAARDLATATPDLTTSFRKLNRFFNLGAFNPGGREGLSGNLEQDRNRQEGYLFWLDWVSNNANSIFSTADASGVFRRSLFQVTCTTFKELAEEEGVPEDVLAVIFGSATPASPCPEGT
jgi:phospholipid/cholesterol/gamma-HCH transport system substrate-binding protein